MVRKKVRKLSKKKIVGVCWCGGDLVMDGHRSTRCLKNDHISFDLSRLGK